MSHIGSLLEGKTNKTMFMLVTLTKSESLGQALHKLNGHKVLSAPVKFNDDQYVMLDLMDIAEAAINNLNDLNAIFSAPVENFCKSTSFSKVLFLDWTKPITDAAKLLANGPHRLIVLNPGDASPVGIISEMDIIKHFAKHFDQLPEQLREASVKQLMNENIVTIKENTTVSDAIKHCVVHRYRGIGIVNEKGELEANFSISDLRPLNLSNMQSLLTESVKKFLQETKQFLLKQIVTVPQDAKLADAMKLMAQNHIHRVYVVDEQKKPIGLLAASDILAYLASTL